MDDPQSRQGGAFESKRADGRGHRPRGGVRELARQAGIPETTYRRGIRRHAMIEAERLASPDKMLPVTLRRAASKAGLNFVQAVAFKWGTHGQEEADKLAAIERFGRINRSPATQHRKQRQATQQASREARDKWMADARRAYAAGFRSFVNDAGEKFTG